MTQNSDTRTHRRACHLCEAICGLVIETKAETIVSIKGDPDDPMSRGHICPKAVALQDIHSDPDRLRTPVRRVAGTDNKPEWQEISWDEALNQTAKRLTDVYREHGVHAIGAFFGNPSVHNVGMLTHQNNLFRHIRTNNRFSATSVDQLPHHLVSLWLFGHKLLFPIPDIDRTDYFLMLGANPIASNGSIWTVPDVRRRITDLIARGGKLVVIDPRKTETADLASEHHFIRPGTDALLLAGILNTILNEGLSNSAHLAPFTEGLDQVAARLDGFSPEQAALHTGIDAETIRCIANDLATADRAICYGRMGVSTQKFGALCQWLIQIINIATGNLDREGGSLFTLPAVDQVRNVGPGGFGRHNSRVRGLPEFDRELPASTMAEEITTPGENRIRAMFTGAGNPVLSTPNGAKLDDALEQLEFMVSLDPYINETTRHADIILPPTSPLEHDHYDLGFHVNSIRNTARYNEPVFEKPKGSMHDWEIFTELGSRVAKILGSEERPRATPAQMIDAGIQAGPYSQRAGSSHALTLEKVKQNPSGIDLGPLQPQLPDRLRTPDNKIHCDRPEPMGDLDRLRAEFTTERGPDELLLIGRRHLRDCNSWMHNFRRLVKGENRCTLMMNPSDLDDRNLNDGDVVQLQSRAGGVQVPVESCDDLMPGVVCLPHGYGHHRDGIRMEIAVEHAGVSINDVTDERSIDHLSGNAAVNGVPVTVGRV